MPKTILAANWKMHGSKKMLKEYFRDFLNYSSELSSNAFDKVETVFALPTIYLPFAQDIVQTLPIKLAAQNIHQNEKGAFTGEISADMLLDLNINRTLIGHSERRQYFGDTDAIIAAKVKLCTEKNIKIIACCGETLSERESGKTQDVVERQCMAILDACQEVSLLTIAYEPVWAIGTGKTATAGQAQEVHAFIRKLLDKKFGPQALEIPILYGGSVKAANFKELMQQEDINGGLVGGASLDPQEFSQLLKIAVTVQV